MTDEQQVADLNRTIRRLERKINQTTSVCSFALAIAIAAWLVDYGAVSEFWGVVLLAPLIGVVGWIMGYFD
jgi:hypothetical protein